MAHQLRVRSADQGYGRLANIIEQKMIAKDL